MASFVELLDVLHLEAGHAERAPEIAGRIREDVEFDLTDTLVGKLFGQRRVRIRQIDRVRIDREIELERLGGRLDVVAVVRADHLHLVEAHTGGGTCAGGSTGMRCQCSEREQ